MILPIVAYGHPALRKVSEEIDQDYPEFKKFMEDLWETMYETDGVGLAAPQVNRNIRVFVIDADVFKEKYPEAEGVRKAFINPEMIERSDDEVFHNEGCLSIPAIHEDIERPSKIRINYLDEDWNEHEEEFEGIMARIIQHEYDHLEGKVFVDHLPGIRKMMLRSKLNDIAKAKIDPPYRMIFAPNKKIKL
ncbi:MAG: peptide deformylase [Marinilabiliales bacterium]|nr:MAG: peptide deformylase [Marinilabiliales bacterium]